MEFSPRSRVSYNLSYPFFLKAIYQGVMLPPLISRSAFRRPTLEVTRAIAEGDTIGREVEDNAKAPRFSFGQK